MPSRADLRRGAEWGLRIALVAGLAFALWRSVRSTRQGMVAVATRASRLGDALLSASTSPRVGTVDVDVDAALPIAQRDWLRALRGAGVRVGWHGDVPTLALSADRAREPAAPVHVRLVGETGGVVTIRDSIGMIDSVRLAGGAALQASDVVGPVRAQRGAFAALAVVPPRTDRRDVLVLGRASWESRFILAALGEAGWRVRARLPVAPGVSVVDNSMLPIDTAHYDVVIALDSTAADLASQVARFVAQGGGVIAAGGALELGALRGILPARAAERRPGRILLESDTLTRGDLPLRPLVSLRADAVLLQREAAGAATAVRRAGRGRAAAVGYDESWRWRMQGGPAGESAHREWWSRMVGLVAPEREPTTDRDVRSAGDPAPRAALYTALGAPSAPAATNEEAPSSALPLALLVLLAAALLAETASRRFRGAS